MLELYTEARPDIDGELHFEIEPHTDGAQKWTRGGKRRSAVECGGRSAVRQSRGELRFRGMRHLKVGGEKRLLLLHRHVFRTPQPLSFVHRGKVRRFPSKNGGDGIAST